MRYAILLITWLTEARRGTLRSSRLTVVLAVLTAAIAVGQVLIFPGIFLVWAAAIAANDGESPYKFLWPMPVWLIGAVCAAAAAGELRRRPRVGVRLLLLASVLTFPFGTLAAAPAAVLTFISRRTREAEGGDRRWSFVSGLRALGLGIAAVIGLIVIIYGATLLALNFVFDDDGDDAGRLTLASESPEEAIRDYAEKWGPPFHGDCRQGMEEGSCLTSSDVSDDTAIYRLCALHVDACVHLEILLDYDGWAVYKAIEEDPDEETIR